jgi:hypothetical protein
MFRWPASSPHVACSVRLCVCVCVCEPSKTVSACVCPFPQRLPGVPLSSLVKYGQLLVRCCLSPGKDTDGFFILQGAGSGHMRILKVRQSNAGHDIHISVCAVQLVDVC